MAQEEYASLSARREALIRKRKERKKVLKQGLRAKKGIKQEKRSGKSLYKSGTNFAEWKNRNKELLENMDLAEKTEAYAKYLKKYRIKSDAQKRKEAFEKLERRDKILAEKAKKTPELSGKTIKIKGRMIKLKSDFPFPSKSEIEGIIRNARKGKPVHDIGELYSASNYYVREIIKAYGLTPNEGKGFTEK